jgi:hypothetical protein
MSLNEDVSLDYSVKIYIRIGRLGSVLLSGVSVKVSEPCPDTIRPPADDLPAFNTHPPEYSPPRFANTYLLRHNSSLSPHEPLRLRRPLYECDDRDPLGQGNCKYH